MKLPHLVLSAAVVLAATVALPDVAQATGKPAASSPANKSAKRGQAVPKASKSSPAPVRAARAPVPPAHQSAPSAGHVPSGGHEPPAPHAVPELDRGGAAPFVLLLFGTAFLLLSGLERRRPAVARRAA